MVKIYQSPKLWANVIERHALSVPNALNMQAG